MRQAKGFQGLQELRLQGQRRKDEEEAEEANQIAFWSRVHGRAEGCEVLSRSKEKTQRCPRRGQKLDRVAITSLEPRQVRGNLGKSESCEQISSKSTCKPRSNLSKMDIEEDNKDDKQLPRTPPMSALSCRSKMAEVRTNSFISQSNGILQSKYCDKMRGDPHRSRNWPTRLWLILAMLYIVCDLPISFNPRSTSCNLNACNQRQLTSLFNGAADASLIVGDSAIEIQEVDGSNDAQQNPPMQESPLQISPQQQYQQSPPQQQPPQPNQNIILGSTSGSGGSIESIMSPQAGNSRSEPSQNLKRQMMMSRPSLPSPVAGTGAKEDITDGDRRSRPSHDYDINELDAEQKRRQAEKVALGEVLSARPADRGDTDKAIAGKVVDFELTPAGGHNKAKIKKKKKKKKMEEEASYKKKWNKKKAEEKKAMEKHHKEHMKKKKEEGKKGKKKWGHEEHGQKKKGKFKKKKWGKKFKKGKGVKKGKKGHKKLKDKGHKSTGFKTVYHKEEYGKSSKWHDIKREKKWDEKAKKWKKNWKKEKGKKYKGEHMKKFEKKKKDGKKYKKENKDKFKKFKKEKFEKGKKMKKEEHGKKKEGGKKKEMKEEKMKKKKKKKKKE